MEVVKNQIDELNAKLTVSVENADIADNVDKSLREYRRKASVPGFRQGHVPVGLMKKMYGNAIIAEELNKVVSNALNEFLMSEKLNIIGEPLPSDDQEQIDFSTQSTYNFSFDIGISPEFEIKLSKRDKINKYFVAVDGEMVNKYIENYRQRYGHFENTKKSNEETMLSADLFEIDADGNLIEGGVSTEAVSMLIKAVKDDEVKKQLIGLSVDTIVDIDIKKAYPNDTEIASMLKVDKEKLDEISNMFRLTVKEVKEFKLSEVDQEFYNKCFGENVITTEEEFKTKVAEDIKNSFVRETKYKLLLDVREKLTKKIEFDLPEAFLKRWIVATNKNVTDEQIEQEFPMFIVDLKWTLIKSKIVKENELKVTNEELKEAAKQQIITQFSQYGMSYIPDEYLEKYAAEILSKDEEVNKLYEIEIEQRVVEFVEEAVKIEEKEVSIEEFSNLFK